MSEPKQTEWLVPFSSLENASVSNWNWSPSVRTLYHLWCIKYHQQCKDARLFGEGLDYKWVYGITKCILHNSFCKRWRDVLLFVDHSVPLTTRVHSSLEVCSLSIMLVQELTFQTTHIRWGLCIGVFLRREPKQQSGSYLPHRQIWSLLCLLW